MNCYKKKRNCNDVNKKNEHFMCYLIQFLADRFFIKINQTRQKGQSYGY